MAIREITDDEKQTFWRDGVVCLRDMFGDEWIARMQSAVDYAVANPGPMALKLGQGLEGKFHGDSFVWTWQYGDSLEPLPDIEAERDQHEFVIACGRR